MYTMNTDWVAPHTLCGTRSKSIAQQGGVFVLCRFLFPRNIPRLLFQRQRGASSRVHIVPCDKIVRAFNLNVVDLFIWQPFNFYDGVPDCVSRRRINPSRFACAPFCKGRIRRRDGYLCAFANLRRFGSSAVFQCRRPIHRST